MTALSAPSSAADTAVHSALACCHLLLQLTQERVPQAAAPQSLDPDPSRDLRQAVRDYARNAGVDLRLERLALTRLTPKMLPLVWRNQSGEFMLLARLSDTQALVQRPLMPTPDMLDRLQLAEQWSGEVIRLRQSGLRFDLSWFVPELLRHRRILGEVLLCSLLLQVLALATPLFFQAVMDKVMVHRALSTLDVLVMTLVVVGLFEVLLKGLREYLAAHTANRIDIGLGVKLLRHLLGLPLLYFKQRQVGAIITRVQELDSIREFLTGSLLTLCVDVAFTLVFFAVMAWISWPLTLLVLLTLPLYALLAWFSTGPLEKRIERQFYSAARNTAFSTKASAAAKPSRAWRWSRACSVAGSRRRHRWSRPGLPARPWAAPSARP